MLFWGFSLSLEMGEEQLPSPDKMEIDDLTALLNPNH
jgi:hypothetical protein